MHTFKIFTVGCKVAQAEGHEVRSLLERFGMRQADRNQSPDLCVINTCAVTSTAAGKSRRLVYKLARTYPNGRIAILGCYASNADASLRQNPHVALIADHHRGILSALEQFLLQANAGKLRPSGDLATAQEGTTCSNDIKPLFISKVKNKFPTSCDKIKPAEDDPDHRPSTRQPRHRALVKIQDGCNAACTYCIIPQLRPKIHSLPENEILDRVRALVAVGHREIVLTGIFLGAYGKSTTRKSRFDTPGQPLAVLIEKLLTIGDLGRLRLSSLEPMDLTPELLKVLASSPKVAGHLHLPLQSGSDNVLRRMGRQYRSAGYLQSVENARKLMPNLALTTDVIVGFPGETDEDFRHTLAVCREAQFAKIHTFPFSSRPGTPAERWKDQVPPPARLHDRLDRLRTLELDLARSFREKFLHRTVRVLVEQLDHRDNFWYCQGRADEYVLVRFPGRAEFDNEFCTVRITDTRTGPLEGKLEIEP